MIRWEALDWDRAFLHKKSPARGLEGRCERLRQVVLPRSRQKDKSFRPAKLTCEQVNQFTKLGINPC